MTTAEARRRGLLVPKGKWDVCPNKDGKSMEPPKRSRKRRPAEKPAVPGCFAAAGLPEPEMEWRFAPSRRYKFDYAWVGCKLALEVEGGVWLEGGGRHNRGSGFLRDMAKYNLAVLLGWRVLRCVPRDLKTGKAAALILEAMGR